MTSTSVGFQFRRRRGKNYRPVHNILQVQILCIFIRINCTVSACPDTQDKLATTPLEWGTHVTHTKWNHYRVILNFLPIKITLGRICAIFKSVRAFGKTTVRHKRPSNTFVFEGCMHGSLSHFIARFPAQVYANSIQLLLRNLLTSWWYI